MKPLRYTMVAGPGDGIEAGQFVIHVDLAFLSRSDAKEFGQILHAFIESKMQQSNDRLQHIVPKLPWLQEGNLVFLPDKAV